MTRWPVWRLAVRKARECARLSAEVRRLTMALAVSEADRRATAAHFALAVQQRDKARDVAVALSQAEDWTESDRAFLATGEWGAG